MIHKLVILNKKAQLIKSEDCNKLQNTIEKNLIKRNLLQL